MSPETSPTRICIEFDDHGIARIKNTAEGLAFLDRMRRHREVQIVVGPDPLPNMTLTCGLKPPPPDGKDGCPNTMCPMDIVVRCSPAIDEERRRILEERAKD